MCVLGNVSVWVDYLACGTLASFPGLPRGEGRPGIYCLRMREFYECTRHEKLWVFTETA